MFFKRGLILTFVSAAAAAQAQTVVNTSTVQELTTYPVRSAPATVVSLNDTRVAAEITGVIEDIPVRVGDRVDAGDLIARLDCVDHEFAAAQAENLLAASQAQAKGARFQFQRVAKLSASQSVSEEMVSDREANAAITRADVGRNTAALESARRQIEKCQIKAPFKAVVIERIASIGELATPGTLLLRLLDVEQLEVSGNIQEQDLPNLKEAEALHFVGRQNRYALELRAILPVVESRLRSFQVRFNLKSVDATPGEAGRVEWTSGVPHLPSDVLVSRGEKLGVFIVQGSTARFQALEGAAEGQPARSELPVTTRIVMDGRFSLQDGDKIQISDN